VALDNKTIVQVAAGTAHSVSLSAEGHALSVGSNELGQLGLNLASRSSVALPAGVPRWDTQDHLSPKVIKELTGLSVPIVQIACGDAHTLCLTAAGAVYAFGDGSRGATGLPLSELTVPTKSKEAAAAPVAGPLMVPTRIPSLEGIPVVQIAAGSHHSLAITATGSIYRFV
jgi:alpha-tubulin suppressor-like RCC1 family protein